jgi:hypothetical protein
MTRVVSQCLCALFSSCEQFDDSPEDGATEHSKGQLPGANNMGLTPGQCHTNDMRDPSQCEDASRNAIMNANAKH